MSMFNNIRDTKTGKSIYESTGKFVQFLARELRDTGNTGFMGDKDSRWLGIIPPEMWVTDYNLLMFQNLEAKNQRKEARKYLDKFLKENLGCDVQYQVKR